METTTVVNVNEVKKELIKNKTVATLSHYCLGNIFYNVKVLGGEYQFPISTVDKEWETNPVDVEADEIEVLYLSKDLGMTSFYNEMKASELNRWIAKAIENNEFIKIS